MDSFLAPGAAARPFSTTSATYAQPMNKAPPAIYIEEQNPDVFYDVPVRCAVTGVEPGDIYVSVTVSHGQTGTSPLKPCGWHNVLMFQKEEEYEQRFFDFSEKVTVSKNGNCEFGIKFLPLSKDGLLPQFPVRVTLSRDAGVTDIIVSSDQFRIIAFKIAMQQVMVPDERCYPRFVVSLINAAGMKATVNAKLEVVMFSTCSDINTPSPLVEWVREMHMAWAYESGVKCTDHVNIPASIQFKAVPSNIGKTAFRLRVTVLSVANHSGPNAVSLTKIGRGWVSFYSLQGSGSAQTNARDMQQQQQYQQQLQQHIPQSMAPIPSASFQSGNLLGGTSSSPTSSNSTDVGRAVSDFNPTSSARQETPLLLTQNVVDSAAALPHPALSRVNHTLTASESHHTHTSNSTNRVMMPMTTNQEQKETVKSPQETFRQFSQAVMKALNGAFNASNETLDWSTDALEEAYQLYEKMDMANCFSRLENPLNPIAQEVIPEAHRQTDMRSISLKRFKLPAAISAYALANNQTQCNNDSSVTLASRSEEVPQMVQHNMYGGSSSNPTLQIQTHGNSIPSDAAAAQFLVALSDSNNCKTSISTEDQVQFVNTQYVSDKGRPLGFPAHREDYKLVGFYEEVRGGSAVQFVNNPLNPAGGVEGFLESFCAGEHGNPNSFFAKKNGNSGELLTAITQSLPFKTFYNFS